MKLLQKTEGFTETGNTPYMNNTHPKNAKKKTKIELL